jgi:hypothetical protein
VFPINQVGGDSEMLAAGVGKYDRHEEQPEADRRHDEESIGTRSIT